MITKKFTSIIHDLFKRFRTFFFILYLNIAIIVLKEILEELEISDDSVKK